MQSTSELRDKRLIETISLLQQKPMTKEELRQHFGVSFNVICDDINQLSDEIQFTTIKRTKKRGTQYKIDYPVELDSLDILQRQKFHAPLRTATIKDIKKAIETDLKGKHKVARTDFIDWFLTKFRDDNYTMGTLKKLANNYGIEVIA